MPVFAGKGRGPRRVEFVRESPKSLSGRKRRRLVKRASRQFKSKPTDFTPEIQRAIAKTIEMLDKTSFFMEKNSMPLKSEKRVKQARARFEAILNASLRQLLNSTPVHERRRLLKSFVTEMNKLQKLAENNFTNSKTAGVMALNNTGIVRREEIKIIKRIVLNGTKAVKKKCREYYKELPAEARKASALKPFKPERVIEAFDSSFDLFNRELALRKNRFFVSRDNHRLVNRAEVRAFEADIVQLFLDELWLNLHKTPKNQRRPFLNSTIAYASALPEIARMEAVKKLHELGSSKAIEAEKIQTLKITMSVWNAVARALKEEASIEIKKLKLKPGRKKKAGRTAR